MKHVLLRHPEAAVLALLFALGVAAPMPSFAMESTPNTVTAPPSNPPQGQGSVKRKKTKSSSGQKQQRSDREFSDGFWVAYNLSTRITTTLAASPSCTVLGMTMMPRL